MEEGGGEGRGSPCKPKSLNFPLLLDSTPTKKLSPLSLDHRPYIGRLSLIAFLKILFEVSIFCHAVTTYLKKLVGTKPLNIKQCPAGLSPRVIPRHHLKHLWETMEMGKNSTQQPKIYSFLPPEKSLLISLFLPLSKMSFLPLIK